MTTTTKTLLTATLALLLGVSVYEIRTLQVEKQDLALQRQQSSNLQAQLTRLRNDTASASRQLLAAQRAVADATARTSGGLAASDLETEAELAAWIAREQRLRKSFEDNPQLKIPELQLLVAKDWADAVIFNQLDSPATIRAAQAGLRVMAVGRFSLLAATALQAFADANDGLLPADVSSLAPYFVPPVPPEMLARYQMARSGMLDRSKGGKASAIEPSYEMVMTNLVDPEYDSVMQLHASGGYNKLSQLDYGVAQARKAYARDHNGRAANEALQLLPYLPQPVDPAKLQPYFRR